MASHTICFNVNDLMLEKILALKKQRKRDAISVDQFCKEIVLETVEMFEDDGENPVEGKWYGSKAAYDKFKKSKDVK